VPNSRELILLGKIEVLESRVEELTIQNESLRAGFSESKLQVSRKPEKKCQAHYLINFIVAAMFPLVAGLFRIIYKSIYGLKK
jgi:hypothetical protein